MMWSERTWQELPADLGAVGRAAILPVGATEQHGPHLGCGVDAVLADRLCVAVCKRTKVPMLPALAYGCSLGHSRRWAGTLAISSIALIELVKEIGDWAYYSGVRRLFFVNTHVTNAAPLRCALEMLRAEPDDLMVALFNSGALSAPVREAHFADDAETSLLLAVAPGLVRPGLIADADDPDRTHGLVFSHPVNRTSANGTTGIPSRADAANRRQWFEWMVEDLSGLIEGGLKETPPLAHSYFTHR